jgi:ketosteroid isomerase-like protein
MTYNVARTTVEALYQAYADRNAEKIAELLADDVEWTISGPADVIPFCGTLHGKAAVLDLIVGRVPDAFRIFSFTPDAMVVDGNQAATLNRLSAKRQSDGRVISYRLAHFTRFRDGKVVKNFSLIDSFDAAEQVLGHALAVRDGPSAMTGNLIAV